MSTIRRGVDLLPLPTQYTTAELVERYRKHLETKINVQACEGIDIPLENIHKALRTRPFEHQGAITQWALRGGKRLIAAQFGLGKTTMASECMRQIHLATGGKTLIIGELNVKYQFQQVDGPRLGMDIVYVRNDEEIATCTSPYMYTNYERVRDGGISPEAHGHANKWPLTNATSGGDGVPDLPPETRQRMAQVWIGRKHRPESLKKKAEAELV